MDSLTGIALFVRVARAKNLSAAARELGITTSAVSKQLTRLETRLGVKLLHRTTRQVTLTEAGERFYERCTRVVAELEEAEAEVAEAQLEPRGTLRVNAPMTFGRLHLGPPIAAFAERNPGLAIEVTLTDRLVDPIEEGFDVSIRVADLGDAAVSGLAARKLATSRRALCAAPSYLAARGTPKRPDDLARHECLGYAYLATGCEWPFRARDGVRRVRVSGRLESNNGELLRELALAGLGIALLPLFLVGADLASGRLVSVLESTLAADTAIWALFGHRRLVPAKTRAFVDFLADDLKRRLDGGPAA